MSLLSQSIVELYNQWDLMTYTIVKFMLCITLSSLTLPIIGIVDYNSPGVTE